MKLEPRGKYAGVKVHLDGEEVGKLLALREELKKGIKGVLECEFGDTDDHTPENIAALKDAAYFVKGLIKEITNLQLEHPDLLEDKSPEKVAEVLKYEAEKAAEKLKLLSEGGDKWKKAKPKGWKAPGVKA